MTSFRRRVQQVMLLLLIVVEGMTFAAVLLTTRGNLVSQAEQQLMVAARVFDSAIANRQRELTTSVSVLIADFGFKKAVASGDQPTLMSALFNHSARIDADLAVFVSNGGDLVASTSEKFAIDAQPPPEVMALLSERRADDRSLFSSVAVLDDSAMQLVLAPVRVPELIGWVAIGFQVDDALAHRVQSLTNMNVTFGVTGQSQAILASTFERSDRDALQKASLSTISDKNVVTVNLESGDYLGIRKQLSSSAQSQVVVILTKSLASTLQAYGAVRTQLIIILIVALILSWFGAAIFANTISRPLHTLAGAARRISQGNYDRDVAVRGSIELDQLSAAFNDMQQGIKNREEQIVYHAQHDVLTDLPNRSLIAQRLDDAIQRAKRYNRPFSIVVLDINGFKSINDTLGHAVGDEVLIQAGVRVRDLARAADSVARLGSDEFLLLIEEATAAEAVHIAERAQAVFDQPITINGAQIRVGISAGIVSYPEHGDTAESLTRRADIALYAAKALDKGHLAIYEQGRDEEHLRRLQLINDMRRALENDEFTICYQPKIDLRSGDVCSVEALLRWSHPERGFIPPDEFIPLAEQSGFVGELTIYVLGKVLWQLQNWRDRGIQLAAAVNLSAHDLLDESLPETVAGLLRQHGLAPEALILEVTESAVMKDAAYARGIMQQLRAQGICMSIDDFGTGHASLAQLKRLPVNELKIDKSFVSDLPNDSDDMVIVKSTIELAHNMGLSVTAEGVETEKNRAVLEDFGCDVIQGYLISKPLSEPDLMAWLGAREATVCGSKTLIDDEIAVTTESDNALQPI